MNGPKTTDKELYALKPTLHRLFDGYETVRSAYLFGSKVTGFATEKSDLDVAIRLALDASPEEAYGIRIALMDDLEAIFNCPVDVVILNSASLKLIHQVFRSGNPIYVQLPDEEHAYRIRTQKAYFDFQYYINKERSDLRDFYGV